MERRGDGLYMTLPAKRNWITIPFLIAWVTLVATEGREAFLGGERVAEDGLVLAIVGGLVFLVASVLAIAVVIWMLIGREEVILTAADLRYRRVAGIARHERAFSRERIRNLRFEPHRSWFLGATQGTGWWGWTGGPIAFDYGDRTHRFGIGIDDPEARRLAEMFRKAAEGPPVRTSHS